VYAEVRRPTSIEAENKMNEWMNVEVLSRKPGQLGRIFIFLSSV
jgi:hypothetical protein